MNMSTKAAAAIQDVERALINADFKKLKSGRQKLGQINQVLRNVLATRGHNKR